MLIDSINVNINLFIFVQGHNVIVDRQETKNKRKDNRQQAHNQQLFPCKSDSF